MQTFLCPVIMLCIICESQRLSPFRPMQVSLTVPLADFLPPYFQACKGASAVRSGVLALGVCGALGPALVLTGASVTVTKRYRPQLWIGWIIFTVAMAAMSTLHADTTLSQVVGIPSLAGIGAGMIYAGTYFPVLAPLPVTQNAHALAFFAFCRSLAAVGHQFVHHARSFTDFL